MKRWWLGGLTAAAILSAGHSPEGHAIAAERLQLNVSPSVSMAPASIRVRAIIEHDSDNRALEIVADGADFYRRTVIDLDGAQAARINELQLRDIPGGAYEVTATLYDSRGGRTIAHRPLMVSSR